MSEIKLHNSSPPPAISNHQEHDTASLDGDTIDEVSHQSIQLAIRRRLSFYYFLIGWATIVAVEDEIPRRDLTIWIWLAHISYFELDLSLVW